MKNTTMKKDFKQFFIQQAGQSLIKQSEFQQIDSGQQQSSDENGNGQKQSNKSSDNQFQQIDDDNNQSQYQSGGIKSAQFWNGIKMPSYLPSVQNKNKKKQQPIKWQVRCALSTGFNSLGRDNIFYLHDNNICKATGCVLIYNQQIYSKHSKKITTISYNQQTKQILTATEGSSPQLFLWKFNAQQQQQSLQWTRKYFIGKKCEDIYAISFFNNDYIIAVERFTLHKSSSLHVFDKLTGKKLAMIKVGKFYDLELLHIMKMGQQMNGSEEIQSSSQQNQRQSQSQDQNKDLKERLFFANDQGIFQLILSSNNPDNNNNSKLQISTNQLFQSKTITCLCPFYYQSNPSSEVQILAGDKQGKISLIFNNKKQQQQQIKVHNGWIFQIKHKQISNKNKKADYFFSLGAIDSQLAVLSLENGNKFNILHKIQLSGYGRSIEISTQMMLLIGKRDGSYQQFNIQQLVTQKSTSNIKRINKQPSLKCFESKHKQRSTKSKTFIINLFDKDLLEEGKKRYAYGNTNSKYIRFFTIENGQQQVEMNDISDYALRAYPQALDISAKYNDNRQLLAYTYDVLSQKSSQNNNEQKHNYQQQQLQTIKSQSFSSSIFSKSFFNNSNKTKGEKKHFQKSILVIEDFQTKELIVKREVKFKNYDDGDGDDDDKQEQHHKCKCTVIKFSPSGKYLVMGDDKGWVFLYQMNRQGKQQQQKQQQQQYPFIISQQKLHKQPIQELIWSIDQKHIKSTSTSQLYYWQIQISSCNDNKNNNKNNNNKRLFQLKHCKPMTVRDTNWCSLSKFSWQTKKIWQQTSFIDQYYKFWLLSYTNVQMQQQQSNHHTKYITTSKRHLILSSTNDGSLRIYNNYPAIDNNFYQIKLNDQPFQVVEYFIDEDSYSFLILIQGMVMVVELAWGEQQQQEE